MTDIEYKKNPVFAPMAPKIIQAADGAEVVVDETLAILDNAMSLLIRSEKDNIAAITLKASLKMILKERKAETEPLLAKTKAAYDEARTMVKSYCDPVEKAIDYIQIEMNSWATKLRIEREAEQQRLEAEARAKANKERQALLEKAIKAEGKGNDKKTEEYLEKAEMVYQSPVFAPMAPKTTQTASGIKSTTIDDVEVIVQNMRRLCEEIGKGNIPLSVVKLNEEQLKKWVKMHDVKEVRWGIIKLISRTRVK